MGIIFRVIVFILAGILSALAQTPSTPKSPAIGTDNSAGPVPGANSYSERQARAAIRSHGYENVSPLVNDGQGIWRGTATKGGDTVQVSVDFKGHVNAR